jgi:hypothetical protein
MKKTEKREAEVVKLTRRLMRRFDGRHHRFLVDFGWEQVARVVLGEKVRLGSEPYIMRAKKSKPVRPRTGEEPER